MLALFHIKEVKMSDYTAIQELLTRDIKLKTFEWNNCLNLFTVAPYLKRCLFFHMYSF